MSIVPADGRRRRRLSAWLRGGGVAIVILVLAGAGATLVALQLLQRDMEKRMTQLRASSEVGTALESLILNQIASGEQYLLAPSPEFARSFADYGRQAHEQRRKYKDLANITTAEQQQITAVEQSHQSIEVEYALAHAQLDVGDREGALRRVAAVRPRTQELEENIRSISAAQTQKVTDAAASLRTDVRKWQAFLALMALAAGALTAWLIWWALRMIQKPLETLGGAARQLGEGDLRLNMTGHTDDMPEEFAALADTFEHMSGQLRNIVGETAGTAQRISNFASDLSSISEEVAASSGEVATAMVGIASGAETQSQGLQATRDALEEMGRRSDEIVNASQTVTSLSEQIYLVAAQSRSEVSTALQRLLEIREVVTESASQVTELEQASAQIDRFVETITGIARQTNLLALNAAIEAARAGEHGRGFAVVAEEVRKLAEGSARAASEVAQNVQTIRGRIEEVVSTMSRSTTKVADVEEVSRGADSALEQILAAVDGVRLGADQVEQAALRNSAAMGGVEAALTDVSGTSESHAASAEEVSAAAEEQSAATQEMSASSAELLHAAERMRELVSGFRV
ncbi:methyl-accepting chemotaxis protein [Longimicrobium terrae]|uniref:Methyl-accepting chemotaxis protein n=1 Tax=Longimicrobium terrae TaxID=1639882 RepID=A0A841H195_9BACT|nr:HAMP domain-containing methyl-accepting chemotaxis protein [Longimicrobium terrae]MBB4637340.1 methyl-accepting chemotaxis protein [Longimicrobium terrae]MBB6071738.1 methyl-accepting chemotaxis protein [Longimicrobium terrae]NNC28499.1 methyl-accepting chemotaxis protein [Longimicrobium terrae]